MIQKETMNSAVYIFGLLLLGFVVYHIFRDSIFNTTNKRHENTQETFEIPAPSSIEIRQAPIYPERNVSSSGPNPPNQQAPNDEVVVYGQPAPKDPYYEPQDSSEITENLRYPERSFRPPPMNDNTVVAVESGIASNNNQISSDNTQKYSTEFIQSGGEFMPGIYPNDTYNDTTFSSF